MTTGSEESETAILQSTTEDDCLKLDVEIDGTMKPIHGYGSTCYLDYGDGRYVKRRVTDVGRWHSLQVGESHAKRLINEAEDVTVVSRDKWPENEGEYTPHEDSERSVYFDVIVSILLIPLAVFLLAYHALSRGLERARARQGETTEEEP